jgi:hypothetical protein
MKFSKVIFFMALAVRLVASEVKIVNATGQELVLDVLSKRGNVVGVKLGAEPSTNFTIGPKSPGLESEMLVVKTSGGEEKCRLGVESGRIYVLVNFTPYVANYIGEYNAKSLGDCVPKILNATRMPIDFELTYSDSTKTNGKLNGPDSNKQVTHAKLGRSRSNGELVEARLTPTNGCPALTGKLKCGGVYYLEVGPEGNLKLTQIGTF